MPDPNARPAATSDEITDLLSQASGGNREAFDRLVPRVYDELRRLAEDRLRRERAGHTLSATALVHEAYVNLVKQERTAWQGRAHFFALASQAMRRILLHYAEARNAQKRRGHAVHVDLDVVAESVGASMADEQVDELLALEHALEDLERFNERGARVVTYRFFGGLTHNEIGEAMGLSEATVRRTWRAARAWLRDRLDPSVKLSWPEPSTGVPVHGPGIRPEGPSDLKDHPTGREIRRDGRSDVTGDPT